MLTYDLSKRGRTPLYEYIYKMIKEDILSGIIKPNEKLPSKRSLASHLKVSVITVENAYAQLIDEGYVSPREKSGYFVIPLLSPVLNPVAKEKEKADDVPQFFIDLYSTNASPDLFPISIWSRLMRREMSENKELFFSSPTPKGAYSLRKAVKEHLYNEKGIKVSADNIIIGSGTQHLFELMILLLKGDFVWAVENPGYKRLSSILDCLGTKYIPVPCDEHGLIISELKKTKASAVHISPSHHFPTGAVMPPSRRRELLAWASEGERYIIEDDYDSEFRFTGRPIPPLFETDSQGCVIYFNSFTKSIAPSIRISYMVLPDKLLARFEKMFSFYTCPVPSFEQYTLARFISEGYFAKHLRRLKTMYKTKRNLVINAISESELAAKSQISEQDSGLHFLLRLNTDKSDDVIFSEATKRGIKTAFLSDFSYEKNDLSHTMIISYSDIDIEKLKQALSLLNDII
jgi:GntR family transcriptional regulator/MocR family aminotransferase